MTIVPIKAAGYDENPAGFVTALASSAAELPSTKDLIEASFRSENPIVSMMTMEPGILAGRGEIDPNYNPFEFVKDTKYRDYFERFATLTTNPAQGAALMRQIDREEEDDRIRASSPWSLLTDLGANLFSPENLIPGGELLAGSRLGASLGKTALRVGVSSGVTTAVSETLLQASQATRSSEESLVNIGASTILGGMLGVGGQAVLGRAGFQRAAEALDTEIRTPGDVVDQLAANERELRNIVSAGAAARPAANLDDYGIGGTAAKFAAAPVSRMIPSLRLATSDSVVARETSANLIDNGFYLKMEMEGRTSGPAVENLVKEFTRGGVAKAITMANDAFSAYRKSGGTLKRAEFNQEIGRAMRRADYGTDPAITQAAKAWRETVFEPLKERAIKAGLLPKDVNVDTALSYFSRVYNTPKIIAREAEFKGILRDWMRRELDKMLRTTPRADEKPHPDFVSEADKQSYLDDVASHVFDTLVGRNADGDMPMNVMLKAKNKRGPLEERTLSIPDALIEDFLESDVELVGRRYARVMATDIELTNKFGSADLAQPLAKLKIDYDKLRAAAGTETEGKKALAGRELEKELARLHKLEKSDREDLMAMRDLLRGTYKGRENATKFGRLARVAGAINYMRSLGGQTLGSLADAARPLMVHGMMNFMRDGIGPLLTNLKAVKMSAAEAREAGAVVETILQTRMASMADLLDPYSMASPAERWLDAAANQFSKLTLMDVWNDGMRSFASIMTQSRVLRGASNFSGLGKRERAYLAYVGIDDVMADRIGKQFAEFGSVERGGVHVANTDAWTDEYAVRVYRAAINRDLDSTIIMRGVGDVPLFMHTPAGRMIGQFKSFAIASNQRVLMRGLQERPSGMVVGAMTATTLGMAIYVLKALEANRGEDIQWDNPGRFVAEGLDRSGLFSVFFEANNVTEKAFGVGAYGALQSLFPDASKGGLASRYLQRSTAAAFMGPTADFVDTLVRAVSGIKESASGDGSFSKGDVNAIRRLLPYATLPGIRSLVDYMAVPAAVEALN